MSGTGDRDAAMRVREEGGMSDQRPASGHGGGVEREAFRLLERFHRLRPGYLVNMGPLDEASSKWVCALFYPMGGPSIARAVAPSLAIAVVVAIQQYAERGPEFVPDTDWLMEMDDSERPHEDDLRDRLMEVA
jgi:hypothetical protein